MVVESEVLNAQNCALSKFSLPMHSDGVIMTKKIGYEQFCRGNFRWKNIVSTSYVYVQESRAIRGHFHNTMLFSIMQWLKLSSNKA